MEEAADGTEATLDAREQGAPLDLTVRDGRTYRIVGRAHPERVGWWFDPVWIAASDDEGVHTLVRAEMTLSQFDGRIVLRRDHDVADPMDAKVLVEDFVRSLMDTIGLFEGAAVDCEVVHLELSDGTSLVLNSRFDGLAQERTPEQFRTVAIGSQVLRGLRLGLVDFRLAIRIPQDTPFLAYRGLDGIRAELAEREGIAKEADAWARTREVLGIAREEIDEVKRLADPRRHGAVTTVTNDDRVVALRLLQRALVTYASWAAENDPVLRDLLRSGQATVTGS